VYAAATKWALKHYLGLEEPEPQPQAHSEEELAEYVGEYQSQAAHLALLLEDGELVLHVTPRGGFPDKDSPASPPPPPTRLAFTGTDQIIALDEPQKGMRADFIRGADGRIIWLRTSRLHRRQ
jgi:hypothetical protein